MIKKLLNKFVKKERRYYIPDYHKYKVKSFAFSNEHSMSANLHEDANGVYYILKQTDNEAKRFEEIAKMMSEADDSPLYSFKCFYCKYFFPLMLMGRGIFHNKGTSNTCRFCDKTREH